MPNVIIEVSHDHLISQPDNLLARVNDTLWQSGSFKLQSDIKSRIYYPNHVLVGLMTLPFNHWRSALPMLSKRICRNSKVRYLLAVYRFASTPPR